MGEVYPKSEAKKLLKAAAILYKKGMLAPKLTAYAEGFKAQKMVDFAKEQNITIEKTDVVEIFDILKKMQINTQIPPEMYEIVARIYTFLHINDSKYSHFAEN